MVKVPRVDSSSASFTNQRIAPRLNPSEFGGGFALQAVGSTLLAVQEELNKVRDFDEALNAQSEAARRIQEIRESVVNDANVLDTKDASENLKKLPNDIGATITNQDNRRKFIANLQQDIIAEEASLRIVVRKRNLDKVRADLIGNIDELKNKIFSSTSPLTRSQDIAKIKGSIAEAAALGAISRENAKRLEEATSEDIRVGQIRFDAIKDPEVALENLENGVYDLNAQEAAEERLRLNKQIEKRNAEAEKALAKAQKQRASELTLRLWKNELTEDEVEDELVAGQISLSVAKELRNGVNSKKGVDAIDDPVTVNDLQGQYVALFDQDNNVVADLEQVEGFLVNVVQKQNEGLVKRNRANNYIEDIQPILQNLVEEKAKEEVMQRSPKPFWRRLETWADRNAEDINSTKARMSKELNDRLRDGQRGDEVVAEMIEREQKNTNPNRASFEPGDPVFVDGVFMGTVEGFDEDGEPLIRRATTSQRAGR